MKTALAFVFLAVCFSAQAAKLSEIDGSAFGKNLLDTVYLELKTGDNAESVLELLQQVEDEVIQEQNNHNARHNEYQASCAADIAEYNHQIEVAQADEVLANSRLEEAYPHRDSLNAQLDENRQSLAHTEETLREATALIEEQRNTFHAHEAELIDAIQIFNQASQIIRQSFGVSFIQTEAASTLANHLNKAKLSAKYTPFLRILAQAASSNKLSQSAIDTISALFQRLIDNAQTTLTGERQTMQAREDAYATFSAQLEEAIANFKLVIVGLTGQLEVVNANIAQWEKDLAGAQERFERFTQKLADRTAICDEENREYTEQTAKRTADLAIIDEVQDLIANRVADFTQYITSTRSEVKID